MKSCPVCKTKYSDDAEFCAKCKAYLVELSDEEKVPFDKKRLITAILSTAAFMLVIAGIYWVIGLVNGGNYRAARELVGIIWNVDYETFNSTNTTEFAQKSYSKEFLEDYMGDIEYNAGVEQAKADKLVSRVLNIENGGEVKNTDHTVQTVKAQIIIDRYEPEDPDMSFFEQGNKYTLVYDVYFVEEEGQQKISQFFFHPEGEEMLPKSQKERLTKSERDEIEGITRKYLEIRYNSATYDVVAQWDFYKNNCESEFLTTDEITINSLQGMEDELKQYNAIVTLEKYEIKSGEQKKHYFDGESSDFYYWTETEYTYKIKADSSFYTLKGLDDTNTIKERLYFVKQDSKFFLAAAEYVVE